MLCVTEDQDYTGSERGLRGFARHDTSFVARWYVCIDHVTSLRLCVRLGITKTGCILSHVDCILQVC